MDLTEEGFKMKIEVCHVEKSLKGREVLKDISCVMESGKIYGLYGHNGSGKTMLFRALSGLIKIDEGKIYYNGENIFSKYSCPLLFITPTLVYTPPTNGITTKRNTLRNNVLYGTETFETPSKNFTVGTNATRMIRSFVATCFTLWKSTFIIIGYIIIQIKIAIGIEIPATESLFRKAGIAGRNFPINTPTIIHRITHTVRYF